jgi:hypothetical protein
VTVAVRVSGETAGPGEFTVPSDSMPGESWHVFWRTEDTFWCGCPAHAHRGVCRHVQQVALAVELEARDSLTRATPETRAAAAARLAAIETLFFP